MEHSSPPPTNMDSSQDRSPDPGRRRLSGRKFMTEGAFPQDFSLMRCASDCMYSHEGIPLNANGFEQHYECKHCKWSSHGKYKNHYLEHRRVCQDKISSERTSDLCDHAQYMDKVTHFNTNVLPCLYAMTNLPGSRYIWFLNMYESLMRKSHQKCFCRRGPKLSMKCMHLPLDWRTNYGKFCAPTLTRTPILDWL